MKIFKKVFLFLCSLKLAVLVIAGLAVALAVGTILESLYDTPTAQFWVYRALWFRSLLSLLGLNIFCVALSRYPWKLKHIPFLLAHAGILILLVGSWITDRAGIDGSLRVSEGELGHRVDLDSLFLMVQGQKGKPTFIPIQWVPPHFPFKGFSFSQYGLPYDIRVDRWMAHADSKVSFIPDLDPEVQVQAQSRSEKSRGETRGTSALRLKLTGGPMRMSEEIWLWEGAEGWSHLELGPAEFFLGKPQEGPTQKPWLSFQPQADGGLKYVAHASDGKKVQGRFSKGQVVGKVLQPGWKGDVRISIEEWIPRATVSSSYSLSRVQYGSQAPLSAIHLVAAQGVVDVWLGLGERAVIHLEDEDVEVGYFRRQIILPFSIRLDRFTIEHDPGTASPASYHSQVTVLDAKNQAANSGSSTGSSGTSAGIRDVLISMNEPLEYRNFTLYQASYEEGDPRPTVSIFAVNRDPGRLWKYTGSLLIVLGSILLFSTQVRRRLAGNLPSPRLTPETKEAV